MADAEVELARLAQIIGCPDSQSGESALAITPRITGSLAEDLAYIGESLPSLPRAVPQQRLLGGGFVAIRVGSRLRSRFLSQAQ